MRRSYRRVVVFTLGIAQVVGVLIVLMLRLPENNGCKVTGLYSRAGTCCAD